MAENHIVRVADHCRSSAKNGTKLRQRRDYGVSISAAATGYAEREMARIIARSNEEHAARYRRW